MMLQPSKRNIKALFMLLCEPLLLSDSLFLSISLTHTHAHMHTPMHTLSLPLSLFSISITHSKLLTLIRPPCWKKSQKNFKALESELTLESYYEQNFTQKDLFGNIGFSNIGQTVNPLQINVENTINPTLIPTGKSFKT